MSAIKERAPARTTPPKRFYCNDCKSKFRARYLANRNTRSTQHFCAVYGKVVTRKVGQKSQKCQCDHTGACLIERKGPTKQGEESEDEAKANQRKNRGASGGGSARSGSGSGRPKKSTNSNSSSKKLTNVRMGNNSNGNNNNSNENSSHNKQFEGYLMQNAQSKKRFQRDDDSEEDEWELSQDKKRRRKNKSKNNNLNNNNNNNSNSNGHFHNTNGSHARIPVVGHNIPLPMSEEEEDEDILPQNNTNNNDEFSEYYEKPRNNRANQPLLIKPVPVVAPIAPVSAPPVIPDADAPPVLQMNDNLEDSDNDIDNDADNEEEDSDINHSSDEAKVAPNNNNMNIFNEFVAYYQKACGSMQNQLYDEALETLEEPLSDDYYQSGLRNHPIFSESYLIMAHAYQAQDRAEEALACLEKVSNFNALPINLKVRIKDTEVQLLDYMQRTDEKEIAQTELARLNRIMRPA